MATAQDTTGSLPSAPTREFGEYDPSGHFRDRMSCDRRPINTSLARVAVGQGTVEENPVDRDTPKWRFRHRIDGCDVVVGAAECREEAGKNILLTAYVDVADARVAQMSSTWSKADVHTAAMLQYLGGDKHVGHLPPVDVDVTDPVHYHGHLLIWKDGYDEPFCLSCKDTSDDGGLWDRRYCV